MIPTCHVVLFDCFTYPYIYEIILDSISLIFISPRRSKYLLPKAVIENTSGGRSICYPSKSDSDMIPALCCYLLNKKM